jgi:hypothetical protein
MKVNVRSSIFVVGALLVASVASGRFQDVAHRRGFTEQKVKRDSERGQIEARATAHNTTRFLNNDTKRRETSWLSFCY